MHMSIFLKDEYEYIARNSVHVHFYEYIKQILHNVF